MSDFTRKIQYLSGLADGISAQDGAAVHGLVLKLLDALRDAAASIDELYEMNSELNDYVESIDDDLYRLENDFDGEMEEGDDDYFDAAQGEAEKAELHPFPGNAHVRDNKSMVQFCPHCLRGYRVSLDDYLKQASGRCPHCGEIVSVQSAANTENLPFLAPDGEGSGGDEE